MRYPHMLYVQQNASGKGAWLIKPFTYIDVEHGEVEAPAGFRTDFASVKPLRTIAVALLVLGVAFGWLWPALGTVLVPVGFGALALYASVVGYGSAAAVIHDRLYASGQLSRKAADRVFYNALRSSGVARWRAWLMWAGVRIGGHWRYKRK